MRPHHAPSDGHTPATWYLLAYLLAFVLALTVFS